MEREAKIKKLQIYIVMFLVTVVIGLVLKATNMAIPFVGTIVSVVSLVTYVFLWISFGTAGKLGLKSKSKYLWLGILVTVSTIAVTGIAIYTSTKMGMELVTTIGPDAVASLSEAEMLSVVSSVLPQYATFMKVFLLVQIVMEIIYMGLGTMIFIDNKNALTEMVDGNYQEFQ